MPSLSIDELYEKIMNGEKDLNAFSPKDVAAAKSNLDKAMEQQPDLIKALVRIGVMKSTDLILKALMDETKECLPIMRAVVNIIARTLAYKEDNKDAKSVDATFFAEVVRSEIDKVWEALQGSFAAHLKETKQEN